MDDGVVEGGCSLSGEVRGGIGNGGGECRGLVGRDGREEEGG